MDPEHSNEILINGTIAAAEAQLLVPAPPTGSVMVSAGDAIGVTFAWVKDISLNSINLPSGPVGSAQLITHGPTTVTTTANLVIETGTGPQDFTKLHEGTILFKTYEIIDGDPSVVWSPNGISINDGTVKWTVIGVINQ